MDDPNLAKRKNGGGRYTETGRRNTDPDRVDGPAPVEPRFRQDVTPPPKRKPKPVETIDAAPAHFPAFVRLRVESFGPVHLRCG
jgi:hypothetical protein